MKKYYAVIWAQTVRWTGEKVDSEDKAKRVCFGMSTPDMKVVDLGTRKNQAMKQLRTINPAQ